MTTQELYDLLDNHLMFQGNITLLAQGNGDSKLLGDCVKIRFHDHLALFIASNSAPFKSECMIEINNLTHYHVEDNELMTSIEEIINDTIFIERMKSIELLSKENYEKRRNKLMRERHIKIYTTSKLLFSSQ
jgi:hypothetical protein